MNHQLPVIEVNRSERGDLPVTRILEGGAPATPGTRVETGVAGAPLSTLRFNNFVQKCLFAYLIICIALLCRIEAKSLEYRTPDQVASGAGLIERLGAQIPLGAEFTDEDGKTIRLGDYFGNHPVILVPAYYQCPNLCTVILNGLLQSVQELKWDAGKQFQIVVVSFDPHETASMAAAKKRTYLRHYGRHGTENGWHFLTGNPSQISQLLGVIGYQVAWDEATRQYAHPSALLVATPGGKISRYFPGIEFPPRELRLALVNASGNRLGNLSDRAALWLRLRNRGGGQHRHHQDQDFCGAGHLG